MGHFLRRRAALLAFVSAVPFVMGSGAARAALIETSTITNYFGYQANYEANTPYVTGTFGAGDFAYSEVTDTVTGGVSAMSLSLTSSLDQDGNFFFLHNASCVGSCYIELETYITFTITNTGDQNETVRFDSLITPGHLARQNYDPSSTGEATFNFTLYDGLYDGNPLNNQYQALGEANVNQARGIINPTYSTSDGSRFNGENAQNSGEPEFDNNGVPPGSPPNYRVLDWDATNVSVDLPVIYANSSRTFTYSLSTFISSSDVCTDFAVCSGLQVAFGDPRNSGIITNISAFGDSSDANSPDNYTPAVGAAYDPYRVRYGFVAPDAPLPEQPPATGPINYDGIYVPPAVGGVPEPSAWALLILGFGVIGGAMRRRRRVSLALA